MSIEHNSAGYIHLIKRTDTDTTDTDAVSHIEEILKPVEALDLDSDSDYSEIDDIFEEFHKDSYLRPNADPKKKHLSKIEADWKTVEGFTDDFKRTMAEVRKELGINQPLFDEEETINQVLNKPPVEKTPSSPKRESPIPIEPENDKYSEASSESLVWQRLLKNSEGPFKVSPPVFDAFRQEEKHWLERPSISWKLVDNCRVKCDKWLDDVFQAGGEY